MRVLACTADKGACGLYRIVSPAEVLKAQGHDVTVDFQASSLVIYHDSEGNVASMDPVDYDVVVLAQPMTKDLYGVIQILQSRGIAVVVELDDDYWGIHPKSPGYLEVHPDHNPLANWSWMIECCKLADLITVTTPALADTATRITGNPRTHVVRNCVPEWYLGIRSDNVAEATTVGWAGNPSTHIGDLEMMGNSLRRAVIETGSHFFTIGTDDTLAVLGFEVEPVGYPFDQFFPLEQSVDVQIRQCDTHASWSPWVSLDNYPKAVAMLDVGVVPLRPSRFNDCKSYLKGLEYAALGIPFVASPTPEYRLLASHGVGLLAKYEHEWLRQLRFLLTNEEARRAYAAIGRTFAAENTYEKQAWRWWEAWEKALLGVQSRVL